MRFIFFKDLLEHRKVHLLVFYDEFVGRRGPQLLSVRWFRFGENAEELAGLPVEAKVPFISQPFWGCHEIFSA